MTSETNPVRVGNIGCSGIGLAYAAWISHRGHGVTVWSPRGTGVDAMRDEPLSAIGVLEHMCSVRIARSAQELAAHADVLLIAVPGNGHRRVMVGPCQPAAC